MGDVVNLSPFNPYRRLNKALLDLDEPDRRAKLRYLYRTDLYYLLRYGMSRTDLEHPWLLARCREVQAQPNGMLDLWSREHYKSTIITYAKSIQDILASHGDDPLPEWEGREVTIGIFSHTRPIAKKFLQQIKSELANNEHLKMLFPDVLYQTPERDAPRWSDDGGLIVKRQANPKESTIEAWGLVDGQPTGMHFLILNYDDVVTRASVSTPEMIQKTTEALELSYNLGDTHHGLRRFIGTRYHYNDAYRTIIRRGTVTSRMHPGTYDGEVDGEPVMWSREKMAEKRRDMGPYTFACQILQNPKADSKMGFLEAWLKYYRDPNHDGMNKILLVDPANEKKKSSDYTVMSVIGLGADEKFYLLDMIRDRLNLGERKKALFRLHRKWKPGFVGYEKYGKDADISSIEEEMDSKNYHFEVTALGGRLAKNDRIKTLMPLFEQGRIYLPDTLYKTDYEGRSVDLIEAFVQDEYKAFPVSVHDDMLDCLARVNDPDVMLDWPMFEDDEDDEGDYAPTSWMAG